MVTLRSVRVAEHAAEREVEDRRRGAHLEEEFEQEAVQERRVWVRRLELAE